MKKFKKLMLVGMMALVLIGVQATSHALTLGFRDFNGNFVVVADGDLNDSSGGSTPDGVVTFNGIIGNWTINVTTGISKPNLGSAAMPEIHLDSVNMTSAGGGRLRFGVVDSGFTGAGPYTLDVGGLTKGQISFAVFGAASNLENFTGSILGTSDIFADLGPFSNPPMAFSGSTSVGSFNASGPFSLGFIADISHDPLANRNLTTSFDGNLAAVAVPEPMSLILLGCGLIAVIGVGRKFRK